MKQKTSYQRRSTGLFFFTPQLLRAFAACAAALFILCLSACNKESRNENDSFPAAAKKKNNSTTQATMSEYDTPYAFVVFSDESPVIIRQSEADTNVYTAIWEHEPGVTYTAAYNPAAGKIVFSTAGGDPDIRGNFSANIYPGDCSQLGARRKDESYSDCFERNFDNFCCDFAGCASLTLAPVPVGIAIALGCASGRDIVISTMYLKGQLIYEK